MNLILLFGFIGGFFILICGIILNKYTKYGMHIKLSKEDAIKNLVFYITNSHIFELLEKNKNSLLNKFLKKVLHISETNIEIKLLYFYKTISLVLVFIFMLMINYTNINIKKEIIISNMLNNEFFNSKGKNLYSSELYNSILTGIGSSKLNKLDDNEKIEKVRTYLKTNMNINSNFVLDERTINFVKTYNCVKALRLFDFRFLFYLFLSFWVPEFIMLLKRLLLNNKYKKEVIKLENVFELLGSVGNLKTIDILNEMSNSSSLFKKHIKNTIDLISIDKKQALELLRGATNNRRFIRLVEVIKTYALIDKKLAIQILIRNRTEKEEEAFISAQEDIDIIDVIAFISVMPVIYYLADLLLKPMTKMIYEAFQYI